MAEADKTDKDDQVKTVKKVVKKKVRKRKKKAPLAHRIFNGLSDFKGGAGRIYGSLGSGDKPTQRMSLTFFFFLTAGITAAVILALRIGGRFQSQITEKLGVADRGQNLSKFLETQKETAKARVSTLNLGRFKVHLEKEFEDEIGGQLAEINLSVTCDSKATCEWIESHGNQARDQVTSAFDTVYRSTILSMEGKRRLKLRVLRQLNQWLPKGEIKEVYIVGLLST